MASMEETKNTLKPSLFLKSYSDRKVKRKAKDGVGLVQGIKRKKREKKATSDTRARASLTCHREYIRRIDQITSNTTHNTIKSPEASRACSR